LARWSNGLPFDRIANNPQVLANFRAQARNVGKLPQKFVGEYKSRQCDLFEG
jgi:hypothetical protein